MSVVKERTDAVDALEHVMQGVQADGWDDCDIAAGQDRDQIASRLNTHASLRADTEKEEEVTVRVRQHPRRRRPR